MEIFNIDLKMSEDYLSNFLSSYSSSWNEHMDIDIKSAVTRSGKSMCTVNVKNSSQDYIKIVAEKENNGDLHFYPLKLSNLTNGFYDFGIDADIEGLDEDPGLFLCSAFKRIAIDNKQDFAFSLENMNVFVKNGSIKKVERALIDEDGNVYSKSTRKNVIIDDDDFSFHVKTPINEWLNQHLDIQEAIKTLNFKDKMDYIGKWLIVAKKKDIIDSSEFKDIFCQAGLLGYSDPTVQTIYKLIM